MSRRLLLTVAVLAAILLASGLLGLDRPLAEWLRENGVENAIVFAYGLGTLDFVSGMHLWFWLAGCVALAIGIAGFVWRSDLHWPRTLIVASLVQFATLATMIAGKNHFGRLRPHQAFDGGDWSRIWFAGGASFPSGHSAFYFGLLLPLAAACPVRWLRMLLLAIPLFVVLARIDLERHFLSDVSASALIAALYALLLAGATRRWLAPAAASVAGRAGAIRIRHPDGDGAKRPGRHRDDI